MDSHMFKPYKCLGWKESINTLIDIINLERHQFNNTKDKINRLTLSVYLGTGLSILLFVGGILDYFRDDYHYFWYQGTFFEGSLIFCLSVFMYCIYRIDKLYEFKEMDKRLESIQQKLEEMVRSKKILKEVKHTQFIESISLVRVIREEKLVTIPTVFLVPGDLYILTYGDTFPASSVLCRINGEETQVLFKKDDLFEYQINKLYEDLSNLKLKGFHLFKVQEAPVKAMISMLQGQKRPSTLMRKSFDTFQKMIGLRIFLSCCLLSLLVNIIRVSVQPKYRTATVIYDLLVINQVYVLLSGWLCLLPLYRIIVRALGSAQIISLSEALQSSQLEYVDEEDVDEFDAAPPPTQAIVTDWGIVTRRFFKELFGPSHHHLSRSTGLIESLSSITVICSADRQGTVGTSIPCIEKLSFFNESGEILSLDIIDHPSIHYGIQFEDNDWSHFINNLKPLGLQFILMSDCKKKRMEAHYLKVESEHSGIYPSRVCMCRVGKRIGLDVPESLSNGSALENQYKISLEAIQDQRLRRQLFSSKRILDNKTKIVHEFHEGNVNSVSDICCQVWNGTELIKMDSQIKMKLSDFFETSLQNDLEVVALAYRMYPETASTTIETHADWTLLGVASLAIKPKMNVLDFVEDLSLAGIRFVYFSPKFERESKAFAERLGLEVDWNACILLSSGENSSRGYLEAHDIKARLPRGVNEIRSHIEDVDDIPLHVSLFAECSPPDVAEMIKIYQEHGEVVCCIGSSLSAKHVASYISADISFALDPIPFNKGRNGSFDLFTIATELCTLPCSMSLHSDVSIYIITQLIKEARSLAENTRQAFTAQICAHVIVGVALFISQCINAFPILSGFQILFFSLIIMPVLSVPFIFQEYDSDVMTTLPTKNIELVRDKYRLIYLHGARSLPLLIILFATYILINLEFGLLDAASPGIKDPHVYCHATTAQNFSMFLLTVYHAIISVTFMSRTYKFYQGPSIPKTFYWAVVVSNTSPTTKQNLVKTISISSQIAFSLISIRVTCGGLSVLSSIPFYNWIILCLGLIPTLYIQEVCKARDKKYWIGLQKRMKLEFNTKLLSIFY